MKLESFKGKKFEALTDSAMTYVIGGYAQPSGAVENQGESFSNDYTTSSTTAGGIKVITHHVPMGGGDWSDTMMRHYCGDGYMMGPDPDDSPVPDPDPSDPIYAEWSNMYQWTEQV